MIASTQRVARHTAASVNEKIRRQIQDNIALYAAAGPAAIERRLGELDREWDIERTLETNAAAVSLLGTVLGASMDRRWFVLPGVVAGFLLQHALEGWCPPLPLFRRLGVRTRSEIDSERYALNALRGDFRDVPVITGQIDQLAAEQVYQAVRGRAANASGRANV